MPSSTLHLALLLAATGTITAQSDPYAYIDSVCSPSNATGYPDLNFPCNAVQAIQAQCIYGPTGLDIIMGTDASSSSSSSPSKRQSSSDMSLPSAQNNSTQQICFCNSQFWSLTSACASCYSAHGDVALEKEKSAVSSLSEKYCAASATPSLGLADYLFQFAGELDNSDDTKKAVSKFKDPVGNKTAISYYYTASVTGSQAWVVADPTATSGIVKDGQLVATASWNHEVKAKEGAAGRKTGVVAAVMGITGLVALVMV